MNNEQVRQRARLIVRRHHERLLYAAPEMIGLHMQLLCEEIEQALTEACDSSRDHD